MNKPASELIALADELSFAAENTQGCLYSQRKMLHAAAGHIRTAANQSGSERAGVDALRDDPSSDERWQAGLDFAMIQLCGVMGVDPHDVHWDAATEEVEGDVRAVMGNILRAKMGEDWTPPAQPAPAGGESSTSSDGTLPLYETAGGFPVAAAPYQAEETGVIQSTRQGAGVERGMDQCVTGGESAAPPSTHGKPDGAVREAVCCSAISPCEYQRTHRIGVCETCQKAALSPKTAAAETSPGDAYREVIDEGLIARHLGVAKGNAKAELNQILDWDVAAALDPAVSGRKA